MKKILYSIAILLSNDTYCQELVYKNDILYGTAPNWQNQIEELKLDIIYPSKAKKLPLIVNMHGGTFLNGSKQGLTKFSEQLAKQGFIVANLEYRQGFDRSPENFQAGITQAVYRAQQDAAAALRWLVHHAHDFFIDTSWLFVGGESAGGVTSLGLAYASQRDWDFIFPPMHPKLGAIDSSGNDLTDQYHIRGVINLWGGIADTALISPQEMKATPAILFQSVNDQVIPFERSSHPESRFQTLHGSLDIAHRFKNNRGCYDLYYITGARHGYGFSPGYMADAISDFVKNLMKGKCESGETENKKGDVKKGFWDY